MANPTFNQDSIKRMKRPGVAIDGNDASVLSEGIGVHNTIPPSLANGDIKQLQLDDLANLMVTLGDPAQILELKTVNMFPICPGWTRQMGYGARIDGQPEYMGHALSGTADATAEWYIIKFTYNVDGFVTKMETAYGSWTGRALLF